MQIVATLLVLLVAVEHVYILILEMFLWRKPAGMRAFGTTPEQAEQTAVLAGNQGLYNGFLAAGLVFGLLYPEPTAARAIVTFFLACVIVAGVYGAATVSRRILFVQAGPALVALIAVWLA